MVRKLAIAAAGAMLLAGCGIPVGGGFGAYVVGATPKHAPVRGILYTGVQGFENVTENPVGPALPKACASGISGWPIGFLSWVSVAWGSSSTNGLDANKKISIVDSDMFTVLGIFGQHCNVYHDGGSGPAAPVAAPAPGGASAIPAPGPVNAPSTLPTGAQPTTPPPPPGTPPAPATPPAGKTI